MFFRETLIKQNHFFLSKFKKIIKNTDILMKLIILFIFLTNLSLQYDFYYHSYNDILFEINDLAQKYPFNVKVYNQYTENIVLPEINSCGNKKYPLFSQTLKLILVVNTNFSLFPIFRNPPKSYQPSRK